MPTLKAEVVTCNSSCISYLEVTVAGLFVVGGCFVKARVEHILGCLWSQDWGHGWQWEESPGDNIVTTAPTTDERHHLRHLRHWSAPLQCRHHWPSLTMIDSGHHQISSTQKKLFCKCTVEENRTVLEARTQFIANSFVSVKNKK